MSHESLAKLLELVFDPQVQALLVVGLAYLLVQAYKVVRGLPLNEKTAEKIAAQIVGTVLLSVVGAYMKYLVDGVPMDVVSLLVTNVLALLGAGGVHGLTKAKAEASGKRPKAASKRR